MTRHTRKQLRKRLLAAVQFAAAAAAKGQTLRFPPHGCTIEAELILNGINRALRPNSQFHAIVAFEASWAMATAEAIDYTAAQAREDAEFRRLREQMAEPLAAATPEVRAMCEKYDSLTGKARKRYGYRHRQQLAAVGARA